MGSGIGEFTPTVGSGNTPHLTYTEVFNNHFPYYLAMGMTYDLYWNDDVTLTKYYYEAFEIKRKFINEQLWLQGAYIYEALLDVAPILNAGAKKGTKAHPYSKRPYALSEKEVEQNRINEEIEKTNKMKEKLLSMSKRGDNKCQIK